MIFSLKTTRVGLEPTTYGTKNRCATNCTTGYLPYTNDYLRISKEYFAYNRNGFNL